MKEDCLQSILVQKAFEKHNITPNIKIRTIEPLMTKVTRFLLHCPLD